MNGNTTLDVTAPRKRKRPAQTTIATQIARPIVKSAGGKTRLLPILRKHLPVSFGRYFEPFCGGAAMFFDLAASSRIAGGIMVGGVSGDGGAVLGDLNADLIESYSALVFDVEAVIRGLAEHEVRHREDAKRHYYFMRSLWNDPAVEMGTAERAAVYIYLSKTCFNGLYRVNRSGAFNVPMGRYKNPTICDAQRLRAAAKVLATATLFAADYRMTCGTAQAGDFVFMDSPYDGESFVSYTPTKFDAEAQGELADFAARLAARGVHVMLTNADTWLVRELYPEGLPWHIRPIDAPRAIAASGKKRGAAREVVITSYAAPGGAS